MKYFNMLNEFCSKLNIKFDIDMYEKILIYTRELINYNKKINLTSINTEEKIIKRHFLDSLSIFNYNIKLNSNMCDIGSGGGFPGIPIKIVRNDIKIDLIESINKKCKFLEHIVNILDIKGINIINNRAEYVSRETYYREKYDYVISRAVSKLNILFEISFALVKINGKFISFKGSNYKEELRKSDDIIIKMGGILYKIIYIEEFNSNLVIINKIDQTSHDYPRKYNIIIKK